LPMLNRLRLFKEDGAKVACEIEENAMRQRNRSSNGCKSWFATIMSNRHLKF
jgi:hypothetical protein